METKTVKELVIYTIKPEFQAEISEIKNLVRACISSFSGFEEIETYQSTKEALTFMDWVSWNSLEEALQAQKDLEQHPDFEKLMNYLDQVRYADHFVN